ncbi:xanthine dehydrogenase YagS FAD-binding subunit [Kibdelosporangium banguiense]|uniref:Xanthine dehydrogenase YagS FAD-binding subunit n=1 Tax=Kibdelosporangium banguiense TaxID=1365924 RepID=A0ABS4TEY0_9PSEU|nr:xanthine dehydrogenase family protein subunit M [Kibdelosporangium banguiense]MBP2322972.1 xanthine dehydrogenase YagS FAD-binding subunit [Kibdelosporangium banguiense]
MKTFTYDRAGDVAEALAALAEPGTQLMAGGTEMVNWLKEGIETPDRVVDINGLPLASIDTSGPLRIGALARMSDVAADPVVQQDYPVLRDSLLRAASAQLRNMATIGGNLLQRTRCAYFRSDTPLPCNKREPGSGCSALIGDTSAQAIFGWSESCVATHPSDLAVALAALDASVIVQGPSGERRIPAVSFHRLPGDTPALNTELASNELIVAVEVPAAAPRSHYLKVRERVSYEFAVVSAAAVISLEGDTITSARIAVGGVAHRPWRLTAAESALTGVSITDRNALSDAVALSFADARPLADNGYKVILAQRAAVRALEEAR